MATDHPKKPPTLGKHQGKERLTAGAKQESASMAAPQRIVRARRIYNQWVANQTLEDYALRFTAKSARRWSPFRVANTAIGAISFLALEAIGGTITINYGFPNAAAAIVAVSAIILITGLPIGYYAATYGVDIDLLTRGAGFGYIGSTITSLIYASFTFIFFAIEAAIMSLALQMCFGIPLSVGYLVSSLVVIPLVTHGITFISRLQLWTQPFWLLLHLLPFIFIALADPDAVKGWAEFGGFGHASGYYFNLTLFGAASSVLFSLIAQIGEQVDFMRFLPVQQPGRRLAWWCAYLSAGPGWILPGMLKLLAGSFLAYLAVLHMVPIARADEPTEMYYTAFRYVFSSPQFALAFTGAFVILSQIKINVTNAYAGSIAWSNFFSRLTHNHPGRVVWLVFNVAIALLLMELGIFRALEHTLRLYSIVAVAWVGALVADLMVNKPLGLSPPMIEFKRAHLYDINPVGVGAMAIATLAGIGAALGLFGAVAASLPAFIALGAAFATAPAIAFATGGKFYIARQALQDWGGQKTIACVICEHHFEAEDMAQCPAYSGAICSLCCSLETRCRDCCKPQARAANQFAALLNWLLPRRLTQFANTDLGQFFGVLSLFAGAIGLVLQFVYFQVSFDAQVDKDVLRSTLSIIFVILTIIAGVAAWLFVLAHKSRRVAEEESRRQTDLLIREIDAHQRTDAKLQKAKEAAEAANNAKSRYLVGLSHELRTPLNAILGYARIMERDPAIPERRVDAVKVVRRSAEHLSGLIDGLLDISKIEAGRFQLDRNEVRIKDFLDQLVDMFTLQAQGRGIEFRFNAANLPDVVATDENRLRQVLINLLSNAIKFTDRGHVNFQVTYRNQVARFEVEDTGIGIDPDDMERIFRPFERARSARAKATGGTGLGLTITRLLIQTMGGELTLQSTPGKGSSFAVRLLLSEVDRPRVAPVAEEAIVGYAGARQCVFVVDDNEVQHTLLLDFLAPLGFDVVLASSGTECLQLIKNHKPNLILLDVSMPEMDGWELARHLRQRLRERPAIVMLSALTIDKNRELGPERLHDDYLMKPVDFRQLLEKIHTLLNIEWVYEDTVNTPAPTIPSRAAVGLPRQQLDELIHLGQIGHFRGILDKLKEIEHGSPGNRHEIARIRAVANTLDLDHYVRVLESMRAAHV
jgi:signal transduction histidine kinase/DNA-binding NarL/FixJ family response regulator